MIAESAREYNVKSGSDRITLLDRFFSVEVRPNSLLPFYKFKLRSNCSDDSFIIVKEDSAILGFLEAGQELNVNYFSAEKSDLGTWLKTKINYIIKEVGGRFKGHLVVGLSTINIY